MNNWDQLQMITSSARSAFRLGRQPRRHHKAPVCFLCFIFTFCLSLSVHHFIHIFPSFILLFILHNSYYSFFFFAGCSLPRPSIPSPLGFYSWLPLPLSLSLSLHPPLSSAHLPLQPQFCLRRRLCLPGPCVRVCVCVCVCVCVR